MAEQMLSTILGTAIGAVVEEKANQLVDTVMKQGEETVKNTLFLPPSGNDTYVSRASKVLKGEAFTTNNEEDDDNIEITPTRRKRTPIMNETRSANYLSQKKKNTAVLALQNGLQASSYLPKKSRTKKYKKRSY